MKKGRCLGRPYHFKFLKDCLQQILLGPFSNTLTQVTVLGICIQSVEIVNRINNSLITNIVYLLPGFYQNV